METYLEHAYDRMGADSSVTAKDDRVHAPDQNFTDPFTTYQPCDTTYKKSYDGLLDWWAEHAQAYCNDRDNADFCNILVTAGRGDNDNPLISGGQADMSHFAVCVTGIMAAKVPASYQEYGMGGEYRAVRTPHHELGHQMMGYVNHSHDKGATFRNGTPDHYMTPMYVQGEQNDCGEAQSTFGSRGWEQKWSDCCEKEW
jgi:hypothetical protein